MKKISRFAPFLLLWLVIACNPSDSPKPQSSKYGKGVLVINEGNFSDKNGSLSFINQQNQVSNGLFEAENNGVSVGGIIQSMQGYRIGFGTIADKFCILTNNTDQAIITDADTLKALRTLARPEIENPQAFASVGNKGYITNWGSISLAFGAAPAGFLTEVDLVTRQVLRKIPTPNIRPQGIISASNKIYVANNNANTVSVYNASGVLVQTITVKNSPDRFVLEGNDKIWVICNDAPDFINFTNDRSSLVRINTSTDQVETTISEVPSESYNSKIAFGNGSIYVIAGKKVIKVSTTNSVVSEFLSNDFAMYGIAVDSNTDILIGESTFTQASRVRRISSAGILLQEYIAGIGSNGFIFYQ